MKKPPDGLGDSFGRLAVDFSTANDLYETVDGANGSEHHTSGDWVFTPNHCHVSTSKAACKTWNEADCCTNYCSDGNENCTESYAQCYGPDHFECFIHDLLLCSVVEDVLSLNMIACFSYNVKFILKYFKIGRVSMDITVISWRSL